MRFLLLIGLIFITSCRTAGEHKLKPQPIRDRSGRFVKVAVIDTGFDFASTWDKDSTPILCDEGHKSFIGDDKDNHGHGTSLSLSNS
jgi:hypothetical protein